MVIIIVLLLLGLFGMENFKLKYSLYIVFEKIYVFYLIVNIFFKYNV